MKFVYRVMADIVWTVHFLIVVIALFGWLLPDYWHVYMAVLFVVLVSNIIFKHCILSKLEFDLRKLVNPDTDYEYAYTSYYTYRLSRGYLSKTFLRWAGMLFASSSLIINCYFKYFF